MTPDQKGAPSRAFEGTGASAPEGLMRNHVRDLSGEKHDLLVMGARHRRPCTGRSKATVSTKAVAAAD